jgi:hypothetical protein
MNRDDVQKFLTQLHYIKIALVINAIAIIIGALL